MSFIKFEYIYYILPIALIFGFFLFRFYTKSYQFVELYWFFKPKRRYLLSRLLLASSVVLLLVSLLDARGPEEVVEAEIPELRTIILIDASASMLAEDIKPNRFQRAIFMARHFVKQAIGHQISIVLFSDIQKKIVPFTDDTDLLDARLDGLKSLDISEGGTNLSQALVESVQYLRVESGQNTNVSGSIVVFTDAEPHDKEFQVTLDEGISVSLVAVGTARGAQIPLRNERGVFQGYKKSGGEPVTTKIDEDYLKSLGGGIKNYKYWVSSSYSMPTDDVLSFMHNTINAKTNTSDLRTRPVLSKYLVVPALILYILSTIFSFGKNWKPVAVVAMMLLFGGSENSYAKEEEEVPLSPETEMMLDQHLHGNLNESGQLRLAQLLLKDKKVEEGATLFNEILTHKNHPDEISLFNWATSKLLTKNYNEAVSIYIKLYKMLNLRPETEGRKLLKDFVRSNLLLATQQQQEQQQQQQEQNQDQNENEEKKEDKKQQQDQSGKNDQNKQDNKDKKDDKKDKGDEQKDQNDSSNNSQGDQQSPQTVEEYQDMVKNMKKQTKVPAVIKQIMSDDRSLQEKHIDTKTEKPQMNQKRDW